MNSKEFMQWFEQQVKTRWQGLDLTWIALGDWHWRLREFDTDTLTEAVRRHKVCEDWRTPSLKKVYDTAKKIKAGKSTKRDRTDDTGVPEAHTYIMCVATGDNGCGCVGRFVPVLLWPFRKNWTPEQYRHAAEEQRLMHSRNGRAGIWEIFTNTTHAEMVDRRMKLCATKPLDLNELRKHFKIRG